MYGGSTIIGADGDVRYVIGKSVRNKNRLAEQAAVSRNMLWHLEGDDYVPEAQPFAMLHERENG
jgi:hypothetical protein